ncbi:MAG TPA: tetratricopeptide repeat protein [Vicinamibacterales bacterium]|nr:tetratricopeptide repeat protein [Vicinamibacterales bacterium]
MSRARARRFAVAAGLVWLLCAPATAAAQAKDDFVRALIDLSQAVSGAAGQDGPALRSSLDAMATALAQWDAAVARVEAGFKGAIAAAAPAEAARMRATLGAAYLERGRLTEALVHLDRAAALDPAFAPTHMLRGLGRTKLNQNAAAAAAFAAARRLEPGSAAIAYQYLRATRGGKVAPDRAASLDVLLKAAIGGPAAATDLAGLPLDLLDDASVEAPLFAPAAYVAGFRLLAEARYPEALASLRTAASLDSSDERARLAKADALVASRQFEAAHAVLTDAVRRYPSSGQAYWRLGRLNEDGADLPAALTAYEAAARAAPAAGASIVYAAIGRLQHSALNLDAAAKAYERRVALAPRSAQAHLDLGTVYQAQDRLEDALVEHLAAALVDPANASAFASAGQLRADQGDDAGAMALLRSAVRLDANHGAARYALGRALLRAGRADEAREQLAAFERIQKGEMEAQRRRFEDNARALESALSKDPK